MTTLRLKIVNEYNSEIMASEDLGVIGRAMVDITNVDPRTGEIQKLRNELKEMTEKHDSQKYWADERAKQIKKMKEEAGL